MARYKCPAYAKNKKDHAVFLNLLKFCKAEYEATEKPRDMLVRLHESMVWWITHHILTVDVQLKESAGTKQATG
jgi:hemerythrin